MSKILDFFKKIPNAYYKWKQRNEKLDMFLENCKDTKESLKHIDQTVTGLQQEFANMHERISQLEYQIDKVNGRLETIGVGTKMELFDTLHRLRFELAIEKRWASPLEKHEVQEIWDIYHGQLKGNGQGQRYYNEIMALPESEDELKEKVL